ncbi:MULTISPECIES: alpha/beta fold hydrolase [unclassified Microbacterium]|uniref:alpha/beta fold hydrolase n=1 Tax=unclassified Microbacterium TaxID=2609290 RepID=UPI000EA90CD7|nr:MULTISPECIES: alpha/beta hydrolase [unclassified Microbacterium]MBT2485949.1 alpha/beta hydrolase [Microbacterium sp. ISL-108]RKN68694.1 alpha/beta hydrolase [Microbacterium sp. CGR2]
MASQQRRVDVADLAFRVIDSARPPRSVGPTVVLVHGIGMSHRYLSRLRDVLAASTRVISIDLPGFAGLPKPQSDVDVPRMGRALADVIATLGEDRIVLVGHSMGAQWVVEAAAHRPELVAAVVAIGPVVDERHRTVWAQARALAVDTLGETPQINLIVFTDYLRCGIPWYLRQVRHMIAYPTEHRVRELTMPLLVMRGEDDPVAGRAWCRRLRDAAPVSRLVEIPGQHHVAQQSAPRAVASAILFHTQAAWPDAAAVRAAGAESRSASSIL